MSTWSGGSQVIRGGLSRLDRGVAGRIEIRADTRDVDRSRIRHIPGQQRGLTRSDLARSGGEPDHLQRPLRRDTGAGGAGQASHLIGNGQAEAVAGGPGGGECGRRTIGVGDGNRGTGNLGPRVVETVVIRAIRTGAVQGDGARRHADLSRTCIGDWRAVSYLARQQFIPDARHVHGDRVSKGGVIFRPHEVAEFQPDGQFALVLVGEQGGVQTRTDGESEFLAQRLHEFDFAAGTIRIGTAAVDVSEVALNPGIAPHADLRAQAKLVHGPRVSFDEGCQAERRLG